MYISRCLHCIQHMFWIMWVDVELYRLYPSHLHSMHQIKQKNESVFIKQSYIIWQQGYLDLLEQGKATEKPEAVRGSGSLQEYNLWQSKMAWSKAQGYGTRWTPTHSRAYSIRTSQPIVFIFVLLMLFVVDVHNYTILYKGFKHVQTVKGFFHFYCKVWCHLDCTCKYV